MADPVLAVLTSFVGKCVAVGGTVGIIVGLAVMLAPRGRHVQVAAMSFVLALVVTQLLLKELTSPPIRFRFPALVTSLHFCSVYGVCVVHWTSQGDVAKCYPSSLGSWRRYSRFILPIAMSLPLSIILNNQGLIYIGAGLSAIVATFAPITTAILSHCLGRTIARSAWIGIVMASCGAVMIGYGKLGHQQISADENDVAVGLLLSAFAVLMRSTKVVLQDQLLAPAAYSGNGEAGVQEKPLAPMHVWALQAPPCAAVSVLYMLVTEDLSEAWRSLTVSSAGIVLLTCGSASCLNICGMLTIKNMGASSMQIIGKVNTLIIITFSIAFFGEELQRSVLLGALMVLGGVAWFEHASHKQAKRTHLPVATSEESKNVCPIQLGKVQKAAEC